MSHTGRAPERSTDGDRPTSYPLPFDKCVSLGRTVRGPPPRPPARYPLPSKRDIVRTYHVCARQQQRILITAHAKQMGEERSERT